MVMEWEGEAGGRKAQRHFQNRFVFDVMVENGRVGCWNAVIPCDTLPRRFLLMNSFYLCLRISVVGNHVRRRLLWRWVNGLGFLQRNR